MKITYIICVLVLIGGAACMQNPFLHPQSLKGQEDCLAAIEACEKDPDCEPISLNDYVPLFDIPICDKRSKYRPIDGSCNNMDTTWFGMAETPHIRLFDPAYNDQIQSPRQTGESGKMLPNPRHIAMTAHASKPSTEEIEWSHLFPFFGQFVDHDITLTASSPDPASPDKALECFCNSEDIENCLVIPTPEDDELNMGKQACMAVPRSAKAVSGKGLLGQREQYNLITSWLDLSQVYGSTKDFSDDLRAHADGKLKTSDMLGSEVMPEENERFIGGDIRATENYGIMNQQIMWLRNHNRIATELKNVNPNWGDEKLFQEARQINIAQYQNVIYNQFIIQFAGGAAFSEGLRDDYEYDPTINPSIINEFATAAYRIGHSLVDNAFSKRSLEDNSVIEGFEELVDNFFPTVDNFKEDTNFFDKIAIGSLLDPMNEDDRHVGSTLLDHLFETESTEDINDFFRFSLPTLNIQRGRDHGLQPYVVYKDFLARTTTNTFDDLSDVMTQENINILKDIYEDVRDIDLFTGGLLESPQGSGLRTAAAGSTFSKIIGKQFKALKDGDFYFFENGIFTDEQLENIKSLKMPQIICANSKVEKVQGDPFRLPRFGGQGTNEQQDCSTFGDLDFNLWKDNKPGVPTPTPKPKKGCRPKRRY